MKKVLSVMLATVIAITLTIPALTAEESKTLTYAERVQALKTDYYVSFQAARYALLNYVGKLSPEQGQKLLINNALASTEFAVQRIGATAMRAIASKHTNFYIKYGLDVNPNTARGTALYTTGAVNFAPIPAPELFDEDCKNRWEKKSANNPNAIQDPRDISAIHNQAGYILHELGHAYDNDFLQNSGRSVMKPFLNYYAQNSNATAFLVPHTQITNGDVSYDSAELFASTFEWMLVNDKTYAQWKKSMGHGNSVKDVAYQQCEALYNLLLRDFGAESVIVKRAAKFLDKELPEVK